MEEKKYQTKTQIKTGWSMEEIIDEDINDDIVCEEKEGWIVKDVKIIYHKENSDGDNLETKYIIIFYKIL